MPQLPACAMDVSDSQEPAHSKNKSNIPCLSFHTAQECFSPSLSKSPKVHIIVILWQNGARTKEIWRSGSQMFRL